MKNKKIRYFLVTGPKVDDEINKKLKHLNAKPEDVINITDKVVGLQLYYSVWYITNEE